MAGQPDWQRYQSSTGPALLSDTYSATTTPSIIYVGPWKSWRMTAQDVETTSVWTVDAAWYLDAAGTILLGTEQTVLGTGLKRDGWRPIVGPYLKLTITLVGTSGTPSLSVRIVPSLLESLVGGWAIQQPYVSSVEQLLGPLTYVSQDAGFIYPGPALLDFRCNQPFFFVDVYAMDNTGTYVQRQRYQAIWTNGSHQYAITLPDAPVQVRPTNLANYGTATFTVTLTPA